MSEPVQKPEDSPTALRYDKGKARVDLVPPEAIFGFADVAGHSIGKYPERNWEKPGMKYSSTYGCLFRHLLKWWMGQDIDPESGKSHLKHVLWNAAALVTYEARGIAVDDRPGKEAAK